MNHKAGQEGETMSQLTVVERELVALGAALACNCVGCVEYHVAEARKAGLSDAQILEAIRLADSVRQVPSQKVLAAATSLLGGETPAGPAATACGPTGARTAACCG